MDYTVQELIHNQSFRRMVKGVADADEVIQWNRWIEARDINRQKAKEATAEIVGFEFENPEFPNIKAEWSKLYKSTISSKRRKLHTDLQKRDRFKWLYRVAAVLLIIALTGIGVYIFSNSDQLPTQVKQIAQATTIKTGPGEQKTITFTDGSKITLNSHSTITYQLGRVQNQPIKVELQGEAYFEAVKGKSEFAVHTPDGIISDIGTKFLVTVKKNHSRVVLQAGKVEINLKDKKGDEGQKITMKKGELLSFDQTHILKREIVNPTYYTSWATGFMQFNHTSLQKFAGLIEKKFGVEVKIEDPKLDDIKISGSIHFKTLESLVSSVSKVAMIPAYQSKDGQTIYFGNKHNEK